MKKALVLILIIFAVLAACTRQGEGSPAGTPASTPTTDTAQAVQQAGAEPAPTQTPAPEPTPGNGGLPEKDELAVCLGQEPESLYLYAGDSSASARSAVLQAIYDGPIDHIGFDYFPVILEKIPSLADGDAILQSVEVGQGDLVVDSAGRLLSLESGVQVYPSGCSGDDCAEAFDGENTLSMDQMVVTFKLLPGIRWSDGTALTVQDSVFSFRLSGQAGTPGDKALFNRTAAYEALDELTVQWVSVPGYKDPAYFEHFWTPLPVHVLGGLSAGDLLAAEESSRMPLGWGPYVLDSWTPGDSILLRRNGRYFRSDEMLPNFERLRFRFTPEPDTALAALLAGDCDILEGVEGLEAQSGLLSALGDQGLLTAGFQLAGTWGHLDFGIVPASYADGWTAGQDRPDFFGESQVRRAIAYCTDRQGILAVFQPQQALLQESFLQPGSPGYVAPENPLVYDPETGRTILQQQGWQDGDGDGILEFFGDDGRIPDGTDFTVDLLVLAGQPALEQAVQVLVDGLAECGIEVAPEFLEPARFYEAGPTGLVLGRRFDLVWWETDFSNGCGRFVSSQIPSPANSWRGANISGYAGTDLETFCKEALAFLPPAFDQADPALEKALRVFEAEYPLVPLYALLETTARRPEICMDSSAGLLQLESITYGDCLDS